MCCRPVLADLVLGSDGDPEVEELPGLLSRLQAHLTYELLEALSAGDLDLVVDPGHEGVISIPAVLVASSLELLVNQDDPLLAEESACGLQQGVEGCVFASDLHPATVETLQFSPGLRGLTYSIPQVLEGWGLLQEAFAETLTFLGSLTNDGADLGETGSV